jgi:hypothetical protein
MTDAPADVIVGRRVETEAEERSLDERLETW